MRRESPSRDDAPGEPLAAQDALQGCLDEVRNRALGLGAAEVHRHRLEAVDLLAGLLPEQAVADLRPVAVGYDYAIAAAHEVAKVPASGLDVGKLLLECPLLPRPQQRIAAECYHRKLIHR